MNPDKNNTFSKFSPVDGNLTFQIITLIIPLILIFIFFTYLSSVTMPFGVIDLSWIMILFIFFISFYGGTIFSITIHKKFRYLFLFVFITYFIPVALYLILSSSDIVIEISTQIVSMLFLIIVGFLLRPLFRKFKR